MVVWFMPMDPHSSPHTSTMDISTFVTETMGVRFLEAAASEKLGTVSGVGDINGDGIDHIAIDAIAVDPRSRTNAGIVFVISANFATNVIYFTGDIEAGNLSYGTRPAGDFNADGIADFLMARLRSSNSELQPMPELCTSCMGMSTFATGSTGVRFFGVVAVHNFGRVGDINGDGIDDIAFGALAADAPSPLRFFIPRHQP